MPYRCGEMLELHRQAGDYPDGRMGNNYQTA
jgi:hypothetical protein